MPGRRTVMSFGNNLSGTLSYARLDGQNRVSARMAFNYPAKKKAAISGGSGNDRFRIDLLKENAKDLSIEFVYHYLCQKA
jgi:hypothetical protein